MARTLKNLPAEDRADAGLSAFVEEAGMELETAEEAFRYARFAAAAQCLDRADAALRKLAQTKAERRARKEAERKAREEAERKAREEAERKGMIQLWKGGPYWATKNIGADNPEDSGLYFWWGDTVGYRPAGDAWVASDGSSRNFSFDARRSPTYGKDVATLRREGWTTEAGTLAPEHDAAHVHWGGDWRMPTKQELDDLGSKCDWTWITVNNVKGYVIRGRGAYADASIFLPAAGGGYGASLGDAGSDGGYWSSVPDESYSSVARDLYFDSGDHGTNGSDRGVGFAVRPVQGFAK